MIMSSTNILKGKNILIVDDETDVLDSLIELFLIDILQALNKKKSTWEKWFERLGGFYDKRFHGTDWREQEKSFWQKKMRTKF